MYKNKVRTMIRSILPSKASKGARSDKAQARRGRRRAVKAALHNYTYDPEDEDLDDSEVVSEIKTADLEYNHQISMMVSERRNADKVNHFVRWAEDRTEEYEDIREKYYRFVSLVGGRGHVIKDHAIGHFIEPRYDFRYDELRTRRYSYHKNRRPVSKEILTEKLILAINAGMEKELNKILRKRVATPGRCKPGNPCYVEEIETHTNLLWKTNPDGSRERIYGYLTDPAARVPQPGILKYNSSRKTRYHQNEKCQNIVQFNGMGTINKIVKVLYRWPKAYTIQELWELIGDLK